MEGYGYQIFTGSGRGRGYSAEEIIEKLPRPEKIRRLIIGWSEDRELYQQLRVWTKELGIELWLWFPVFSEHSGQAALSPLRSFPDGALVKSKKFQRDETFDFCCPGDEETAEKLVKIYDNAYQGIAFDGIFLDKIRYPSMDAGFQAFFGCGCGQCRRWLKKEGILPEEIQDGIKDLEKRIRDVHCENPLELLKYEKGIYRFGDPFMERIVKVKEKRITEAVRRLIRKFRGKGLKIGLDLFSPFLAPFVGQDYYALAREADLVKPMLYSLTDTPAGMRYEWKAVLKILRSEREATNLARERFLYEFYGTQNDFRGLFEKELQTIKEISGEFQEKGRFVPGIEIHTAEGKPLLEQKRILENVQTLEFCGFRDRIACWDIMSAGKEEMELFTGEVRMLEQNIGI